MKTQHSKLSSGLLVFLMASLAGFSAQADDTEIFFGGLADTNIQPNVLFILDNSLSMTSTDGGSTSRMDRMKSAMTQLLQNMNNINVGIMQFSYPGAAVVYPVTDIDKSLSQPAPLLLNITSGANDVEEATATGTVTDSNVRLALTDRSSTGNNTLVTQVSSSLDDAEEYITGGTITLPSSPSLELPIDDLGTNAADEHVVGVVFRGQTIPQGATIISAKLEFATEQNTGGNAAQNQMFQDPLNLEITGELYTGAAIAPFSTADNIAGRPHTTSSVTWNITSPAGAIGDIESTPNLAAVIQEIVSDSNWPVSGGADIALFLQRPAGDTSTGARVFSSFDSSQPSPKLTITYEDPATTQTQMVGLRYNGVNIPQGVTITAATLEFTSASDHSNTVSYNIFGDAAADSTVATTADNLSSRTTTTSTVSWTPGAWKQDGTYTTPDLSSVIQEIVGNASWCGGNALTLMLANGGDTRFTSAYEDAPGKAPKLKITYDPASIPVGGGCVSSSLSYRIDSNNNDGDGRTDRGTNDLTDDKVILGNDGNDRLGGFRFNNIQLPQGARIQNAYLEFTAYANNSSASNLTIKVENSDNAPSLCANRDSRCYFRSKSYSGTTVSWNSVPAWTSGVTYQTPDISTLVQTTVNRAGWSEGNAMFFALQGSGLRQAVAHDYSALSAARLVISYQANASSSSNTARDAMISLVNDIQPKSYTPIVDSLYEAALYYRGDAMQWGTKRVHNYPYKRNFTNDNVRYLRVSHEDSYTGGNAYWPADCDANNLNSSNCISQSIENGPVYTSPITSQCQTNHIVLLTDGEPSQNESISLIQNKFNVTCTDGQIANDTDDNCAEELATKLNANDQLSTIAGSTIQTHTIAFNTSTTATNFLDAIATAGGDSHGVYTASSANDLLTAFTTILGNIIQTDTTFVSPGVTVNTFNRLTHRNEIYYALFSPESTPSWPGNLKRYGINSSGYILDSTGTPAIDLSTGFFKKTAQSYWSGTVDGPNTEKGGAAENLPASTARKVYTYYSTSPTKTLSNTANAFTVANKINIPKTMMGISAETDAYHDNLINWARGLDPVAGTERKRLADPLHSIPHLVTYGGTNSSPDLTIFYGDNEGFFHAIDASNGNEIFSFIPEELLPILNTLYVNNQADTHPYGIDGPVNSWVKDVDNDSQIEPADGDHVYVYFGMRRGGRSYYALDVTDRDHPKLMWRIEGGTGDFTELGQTWSKPIKTKVDISGTVTDVLIFSGGYDANQDNTTVITPDTVGRSIFMVNATTGARIWSAGPSNSHTLKFTEMLYSIPATPRTLDINNDGLVDQLYVGDVGGQLWRIDFENGNGVNNLATGAVIADISDGTTAGARRFYHEPDVSVVIENNTRKLAVSIGSGFRAHPLSKAVDDRMYMFKQEDIYDAPPDGNDAGTDPDYVKVTEADLYDATQNDVQSSNSTTQSAALTALAATKGWYVKLEASGEKMISTPLAVSGIMYFTTYSPEINTTGCVPSNGTSRLYTVHTLDASTKYPNNSSASIHKSKRYEKLLTVGLPADPVRLRISDTQGTRDVLCVGTECETIDGGQGLVKTYWYTEQE